ncbi:MAG: hypothetical protein U0169_07170 [Polyangiaceae bacterium]
MGDNIVPRAGVLDCHNGPEPPWTISYGTYDNFNACLGTLDFKFGRRVLSTGASGGPVSAVTGTLPPNADRMDCGPGCAIADEKTLVLDATSKIVTIVHEGHTQWKFGWHVPAATGGSTPTGVWAPEPYLYEDLVALESDGASGERTVEVAGEDMNRFANATGWVLTDRTGAYVLFRPDGPVWRVKEMGDSLAAMDKRVAGPSGPTLPSRGRVLEFVRTNGRLSEIRDFRYPKITALVVTWSGDSVQTVKVDVDTAGKAAHVNGYVYDGAGRLKEFREFDNGPTLVEYKTAPGLPPLPKSVESPTHSIARFEYRNDGRLSKLTNEAAPTKTPAEDTFKTFTYGACGGGALADAAATFPYTSRPFACTVVETDDDGYGRGTRFAPFPGTGVPASRAYRARAWDESGGHEVPGTEEISLRNDKGYLLGTKKAGANIATRFRPSDGRPSGTCVGVLHGAPGDTADLDVDLSSATKAADTVSYEVRCYDTDNMLVREVSADGEKVTEYQKSGHPRSDTAFWNTFGWAAQMPMRVTEKFYDAAGDLTTHVTLTAISEGAGASGNPDAKFVIHGSSPFGGGTSSSAVDARLRTVATIAPGTTTWSTTSYDDRGHEWKTSDPVTMVSTVSTYHASGNVDTASTNVCSADRTTLKNEEDPVYRVVNKTTATTLRASGDLVTTTVHELEAPVGRPKKTTITTPGFTQVIDRQYATTGDRVIRESVTTSVGTEQRDVSVSSIRPRGFALP